MSSRIDEPGDPVADPHASRVVHLERGFNVRDLGGLPTTDGKQVRYGRIYRSDDPFHASSDDVAVLRRLGIRTVLDLRMAEECAERGTRTWDDVGAVVHACPLVDTVPEPSEHGNYIEPAATARLYVEMLTADLQRHPRMWRALADASSGVSVIHCWSGRDRTGIVVALLLGLLSVEEEHIVEDYAMSTPGMTRMLDWAEQNLPGGIREITGNRTAMGTTWPDTMRLFLAEFRNRFGSAAGYAREVGIEAEVDVLRENLLEPLRN